MSVSGEEEAKVSMSSKDKAVALNGDAGQAEGLMERKKSSSAKKSG
jgi:hypothetical protein